MLIQHILSIPETLGHYSPKFTQFSSLSKYSPLSLPYYKMKARSGGRWVQKGLSKPEACPWLGNCFLRDVLFYKLLDPPPLPRLLPGSEKLGTAQ